MKFYSKTKNYWVMAKKIASIIQKYTFISGLVSLLKSIRIWKYGKKIKRSEIHKSQKLKYLNKEFRRSIE